VEETFDVQVLPGIVLPYVSGPSAEMDTGQPLWTVPPDANLSWDEVRNVRYPS